MADSIRIRIAVGLSLIAAITGLLALDHATGHGYGVIALSVALQAAGLWEYGRMAPAIGPATRRGLVVAGAGYVLVKGLGYELDPRLHLLELPLVIGFAYAVLFASLRGAPSLPRFQGLAATAFGFFYLPFLGGFALDVRFLEQAAHLPPLAGEAGAAPLAGVGEAAFFYLVAIAKGTDICAYFAGKLFGRTKLVPSVSPGKTVAGFVGALAGGAAITALFAWLSPLGALLPLALAPGAGILMALVVVSGDLIESFLKRSVEVKDSANLLPNFGGVLDVVDSIVIAAPAVYLLLSALAWLWRASI